MRQRSRHRRTRRFGIKSKWATLVFAVIAATLIPLALIRWYAPTLLGIPPDLQMVQVSRKVPPFYDGVFRTEDYQADAFFLQDPYVKRSRPLYPDASGLGPTDILGFRNRSIPNVVDVVIIGDSQTYGNNAVLEENWPSQMNRLPSLNDSVVYNMSVGGWGPVEYLEIFPKALHFQPRVVVVAFYSGNDAIDAFRMAYSSDRWESLRPNGELSAEDIPAVAWPPPQSDRWKVQFEDGVSTTFTPRLRHAANQNHPAIAAGYDIMVNVARRAVQLVKASNVKVVFTIIPSKELAHLGKTEMEDMELPEEYLTLTRDESTNIRKLADQLQKIPGVVYVDTCRRLQDAALESIALYPSDIESHPNAAGYAVIGQAIADALAPLLPEPPDGLVAVPSGDEHELFLSRNRELWIIRSRSVLVQNGWKVTDVQLMSPRDIAGFPYAGVMDHVDLAKFGPR